MTSNVTKFNNEVTFNKIAIILKRIDEICPTEKTSLRMKKFVSIYNQLIRANELLGDIDLVSDRDRELFDLANGAIEELAERVDYAEDYSLRRRHPIQYWNGFEWDLDPMGMR